MQKYGDPMHPTKPTPYSDVSASAGVYLIATPERDRVKIGLTSNLRRRLCALSTVCGLLLTLEGFIEGAGVAEERLLHVRFAEHRLLGEWFTPTPEIFEAFGLDPSA